MASRSEEMEEAQTTQAKRMGLKDCLQPKSDGLQPKESKVQRITTSLDLIEVGQEGNTQVRRLQVLTRAPLPSSEAPFSRSPPRLRERDVFLASIQPT